MRPSALVLLGLFSWLAIFIIAVWVPLASGKIRVGRSGSPPVLRDANPGAFWTAFTVSTLGLVFGLAIALFVLHRTAPDVFAEMMHRLRIR
jgi:uncharacterized BrkB/YihY/UPF0761 family membrane protein